MRILIFLLFCYPLASFSQSRLHITLFGGLSTYQGDLQQKRFSMEQSNVAFGGGLRYELTNNFALRGELRYGHLEGSDANNTGMLRMRNLSFRSRLYEASFVGEYVFFDLLERRMSPYIFAGLAVYHFSPWTVDTATGKKVFLQPLGTEGQDLPQYPDRKKYSLDQFAIPFGGGFKFVVNEKVTVGFELGLRKLFTDYIDDVSTTYVDPAVLLDARGPMAVEYAYRGDELKDGNPNYPEPGSTRGGKFNDWYYHTGITATFRIFDVGTGTRSFGGKKYMNQMNCPKF